jgi:hypothetical protein
MIRRAMRACGIKEKVTLFRELEHLAYQEMRRFMLSGSEARFIM